MQQNQLTKHKPSKLFLRRNKRVEMSGQNEAGLQNPPCSTDDVSLYESGKLNPSPSTRLKDVCSTANTADMDYKRARVCVCAHNWLCTVTQIAAQKNKKVFRLYFCYFTKSISLCHFGGFTRLYISWNASSGFAPNENMKVGGKNKSADFLSYRLPARLKSLFFFH